MYFILDVIQIKIIIENVLVSFLLPLLNFQDTDVIYSLEAASWVFLVNKKFSENWNLTHLHSE